MIIGLVGTSGAGKSTISEYLINRGFFGIELSSLLKTEAQKKGIKHITKSILQDIGNDLRKLHGPQVLAEKALKEINKRKKRDIVIVGIRNLAEITLLKKQKNFFLIGIDAKPFFRYQRIIKQRGKNYIGSFADFLKIERRDSQLGNSVYGLRVRNCIKKATKLIQNNNDLADLYNQIDLIINKQRLRKN